MWHDRSYDALIVADEIEASIRRLATDPEIPLDDRLEALQVLSEALDKEYEALDRYIYEREVL